MPETETTKKTDTGVMGDLRFAFFRGRKITVAGLGEHGGATGNIKWLHEQGAILTVTDLKSEKQLAASLKDLRGLPGITWVLGQHRQEDFTSTQMVLRNPAMPANSPYLEAARRANVPIEMDSSLFLKFSPTKNIVGITGSKGKSTTANAIAQLLSLRYAKVALIGTEGTAPLPELSKLNHEDMVVFELSSWRLEALAEHELSPCIAVVTSLYEDHLNTYESFEHYMEAKKAIVSFQGTDDLALLNYDDPRVRDWSDHRRGRVAWFSLKADIPGDGICVEHRMITIMRGRDCIPLFPLAVIPTEYEHQQRNILSAIFLAFCYGVSLDSIRFHLQHLKTLRHRLELVRENNGVSFINDSAATIPDATIAALHALENKSIVLILGGSDKHLRFQKLAEETAQANIRGYVFLPGNATNRMFTAIKAAHLQPQAIHFADSMTAAVHQAAMIAHEGDVVLLSPGATSFGLFKHEFDRGDQFIDAVKKL